MAGNGDGNARAVIGNGSFVERLLGHPRLALVAGVESARPTVHVWELRSGELHEIAVIDSEAAEYPSQSWLRADQVPAVAWHPHEPRLLVTGKAGLRQWSPAGLSPVDGRQAPCRFVAFSPDGSTVWASPASSGGDEGWESSDALDLATGALRSGPRWDTGVAEHPGGGLLATLTSNQGATYGLFARPDDGVPARMRVLRRALILDADNYKVPVFSADGRYLAIRGNAYVQSLDVFEFPSLRKVLHTTLGEPYPGFPYPPEWLKEQESWSHHNIAFAPRSGALLVGTPLGTIAEIYLDDDQVAIHEVLDGTPVSALAVLASGELVIASRAGALTVAPEPGDAPSNVGQDARDRVAQFIAATTELPDDADLDNDLLLTDGSRTWDSNALETVTTAAETDPAWLQLRAAINSHRDHAL